MSVIRFVARVIIVAAACALATCWFGWVSLPFVGFLSGIADRHSRAAGTVAAMGAAAAWAAILAAQVVRGANVAGLAERIGAVMQVPGFIFGLMTLVFAALLCGTAAVVGAASAGAVSPRGRSLLPHPSP
jgi:hypothetical protein